MNLEKVSDNQKPDTPAKASINHAMRSWLFAETICPHKRHRLRPRGRFVPGYKAVSTVDLLMNAPFDE